MIGVGLVVVVDVGGGVGVGVFRFGSGVVRGVVRGCVGVDGGWGGVSSLCVAA